MRVVLKQACKRMTTAGLCLLLIMGALPPVVLAEDVSGQAEKPSPQAIYQDVPEQAYYAEALEFLARVGVVEPNAEGGFAPDIPVTRAELAVWLARALGLQPVHASAFTDVPVSSAETPYIQALHQAGLVRGYEDGTFRGDQPITRAETAALLARVAGRTDASRYAEIFADVHADDWFADAVGVLANLRVMNGKADGTFAPADLLTRGEAAALLYRLLFEERRIEALEGDTVTINGHTYRYADTLAGLFWEINRNALVGSVIQFVNEGDTIVSVTGLDLRGGSADADEPILFDGAGGVIDGSLYVSAPYAIITDIHIQRDLIITPSSRKAVLLHGLVVEGRTVLTPVADSPEDPSFIFLYADAAFVEGVLLARDADVVNLSSGPILAGDARAAETPNAMKSTAKSDKPVAIASLGPFFNAEWYLENNPDISVAGNEIFDYAKRQYEKSGRYEGRSPAPLFDPMDYLNADPDDDEDGTSGYTSLYDHFMQNAAPNEDASMKIYDLQAYLAEDDTHPQDAEPPSPQDPPAAEEDDDTGGNGVNRENGENGGDGDEPAPGGRVIRQEWFQTPLPPVSWSPPPDPFPGKFDPIRPDVSPNTGVHAILDQLKEQYKNRPQRYSLHFIGSSIVNISSNTELDIIVPGKNTGKVVINGDAEQLAIRFASPESDQSIVIEINGQVDQIALSGSFNGEIVFTGSGNIGAVNTEGDPSDAPSIRFEGELEVGTVNGRPAAEPQPAASPSPGSGSSSRPVYYPSVTEAVYTAYANHATFEIEAADAAKIYYAAMHPASDEPSARKLKEMASGTDAEGMRGTVTVSKGWPPSRSPG